MTATYTLPEVAADLRLGEQMKDPVRWLTEQIRKKRIKARKVGRHYVMTPADIEAALETFATTTVKTVEPEPRRGGLSVASSKRRVA